MLRLTSSTIKPNFLLQKSKYFGSYESKDYFLTKKQRQIEQMQQSFNPETSKMRDINLNFRSLAPNFFTKTLPLKQIQKIKMPTKISNAIQNSYISLELPVSTDLQIQNNLIRLSSNQVRIGRILQCMDSIAGIVGYRHCFGSLTDANPFVLVTGCVDSINLFEPITIQNDIKMQGYLNYVGRTSMEVQINLFQKGMLKSSALFTMVSRNAQDHTKSYPCPKLQLSHLSQEQLKKANKRQEQAIHNVERRKKQLQQSYKISPPTPSDSKILHNIFLNINEHQKQGINIQQTVITNTHLMHIQQRNIHNKIFGGFLMRQMVQSGWIVASRFAQHQDLIIEDLTNIYFKEPVEIGCHLKVKGRVSYTFNNVIVVTMEAYTYTFRPKPVQKLCCLMHMFLKSGKKQRQVFPKSYEDGIHYLTSRNAYETVFN